MRWLLIWGAMCGAAWAEGEATGEFDYYVMSLSWSANWCALEGDARGSDQCDARKNYGWILHGLWPQFERGYPSDCQTDEADPSRVQTRAMRDIMASDGLAWHQWKKHGRCAGLSATAYFETSREAFGSVTRPPMFRQLDKPVILPAKVVEEAFLEANPKLTADMITITCRRGHIQEARVCLTKALEPRVCGADVVRDCDQAALFNPMR